jgi:hypothetical protein
LQAEHRFRGPLLACLLASLGFLYQLSTFRNPLGHYDRGRLPGFDAYVYMAMADHPAFFTLPPWGYRILTPWAVHLLPIDPTEGFLVATLAGLGLATLLLFFFLRRLGVRDWLALAGVAAFVLSPPVREALHYRFLSEPFCVLLEVALLLALEASPEVGLLALVGVLGVLAKEEFLLFLPVIWFSRRDRRGFVGAAVASIPAVGVFFVLRSFWAPLHEIPATPLSAATFWLALYRILSQWQDWGSYLLLALILLNAFALTSTRGRSFLARYAFVELVSVGVAFGASVYTQDAQNVPFFPTDIPRLLIYAVPIGIAAGLVALEDRLGPLPPPVPLTFGRPWAFGGAVLLVLLPLLTQDRYRRTDLRGPKDGRLVLAFCRESVAFAERLQKEKPVRYEVEARRFPSEGADPQFLERMRWFLRDGWGTRPQYQTGAAEMEAPIATVVLPCLRPGDWTVVLFVSAHAPATLGLLVNGRRLAELPLQEETERLRVSLGAKDLFRGDNVLELHAERSARVVLRDLAINPARSD